MERERRIIKEMPDKETLEEFVNGMSRPVKVSFNIKEGKFEWINEDARPKRTDPKP